MMVDSIIATGAAAAGVAHVVRAIAPIPWLMRKPLSCDLCMSWWTSLAFGVMWSIDMGSCTVDGAMQVFGGVGVSVALLKLTQRLGAAEVSLDEDAFPKPPTGDQP
jgi:hypothetical protein